MKFSQSLKKNRDFQNVYKKGKSYANRYLVMYVLENDTDRNRLGISVSKKVGNSVIRHHLTRLIREGYRLQEDMFNSGLDIVVVARSTAKDISYHEVESALLHLGGLHKIISKEKKMESKEAFLSLPEEEAFKYFDIFKKTLSGTVGKNILNMEFPIDAEMPGGTQEFLLKLRSSKLQDDMLLEEFYDKVIEAYDCAENYYIILIHAMYDVPGKSSDGIEMFDASDEVYEYLLMSLCPVSLSKAGLSYNAESNCIQDRIRDWIVDMPDKGFLFPAFNDRSTDLHSMLYYTKKSEDLQPGMIDQLFGTKMPMSADTQKETFKMLIEDTLGEDGDYETVRNIHETLNQLIEEHKEEPEPLALDLTDMKKVFEQSGVEAEKMESFDRNFTENAGEKTSLLASNIAETRKFQIETPDIVIKVNPERADLVETRIIDGRRCLVIPVDDHIEVNRINVQTIKMKEREENQETYN